MKKLPIILVFLLQVFVNLHAGLGESKRMDWLWVDYPWAYSAEKQSWIYFQPINDHLWIYHYKNQTWTVLPSIVDTTEIDGVLGLIGKTIIIEGSYFSEKIIISNNNDMLFIMHSFFDENSIRTNTKITPNYTNENFLIFDLELRESLSYEYKIHVDKSGVVKVYINHIRVFHQLL